MPVISNRCDRMLIGRDALLERVDVAEAFRLGLPLHALLAVVDEVTGWAVAAVVRGHERDDAAMAGIDLTGSICLIS